MKTTTPAKKTAAPAKLDLLAQRKAEYKASSKPCLIDIKPAHYLVIEGTGSPDGPVFEARVGALYSMAFTIKMSRKFAGLGDYAVSRLEAVYPGLGEGTLPPMEEWRWKLMILSPDFLTPSDLAAALELLKSRGKEGDAALVSIEKLHEGTCVQVLHTGPYDEETASLALLEAHAKANGKRFAGPHHEIYISDPRRVEPSKIKTLLRWPVCPL